MVILYGLNYNTSILLNYALLSIFVRAKLDIYFEVVLQWTLVSSHVIYAAFESTNATPYLNSQPILFMEL